MRVGKVRLTIEYEPDWAWDMKHNEIPIALAEERQWWEACDNVMDLEGSGATYTMTIEVVP